MRKVAVFDTNVLVSGFGWRGSPSQCLELARLGIVGGVTCRELLEELARILRTKLGFSADEVAETVADAGSFLRLVPISGRLKAVPEDPTDNKVLECATVGQATHVVTGDRAHLLCLGQYQDIAIVSPAEFVRLASAR